MALAVFSPLVAACSSAATDTAGSEQTTTSTESSASESNPSLTTTSRTEASAEGGADGQQLQWARASLGFVSAYVLARGNSAAIIDTGSAGSAEAIGQTLQTMGLNYSNVEHLILTHKHGDHAGSLAEVLQAATSAKVYAGEADLGGIDDSPVDDGIVPLLGGEDVFGLQIVASPGHTAGHVCAFDATTGLLVAGDALFTEGGQVIEGPERFFEDIPQSRQTIRDLATLSYNTLLVGHGDPIEGEASAAVGQLAASLS